VDDALRPALRIHGTKAPGDDRLRDVGGVHPAHQLGRALSGRPVNKNTPVRFRDIQGRTGEQDASGAARAWTR
jgi:hypothetical protein